MRLHALGLSVGGQVALLVASLALVAAVAAVGGAATARSVGPGSWYEQLDRAPWSPPDQVFGPAWGVLYLLMALAAWGVAREGLDRHDVRVALVLYIVQLALNLAWSWLFFGLRLPGLALAEILGLLVAIGATAVAFHRVTPVAGLALVPYLGWVAFAATLNGWVALRD